MVGLTGLEPVTLRLSSACSNQLSYRPVAPSPRNFRISIVEFRLDFVARSARSYLNRQSKIANRKSNRSGFAKASTRQPRNLSGFGGKGIRTPDFQLAKLALYQLSYAPARTAECRLPICDFKKRKCRMSILQSSSGICRCAAAKIELCVTVVSLSPDFLSEFRVFTACPLDDQLIHPRDLAVDLSLRKFEIQNSKIQRLSP
jgi:hypothetical protein